MDISKVTDNSFNGVMSKFIRTEQEYTAVLSTFMRVFFPQLEQLSAELVQSPQVQTRYIAFLTHLLLLGHICDNHARFAEFFNLPPESVTVNVLVRAFTDFPENIGAYNSFCGREHHIVKLIAELSQSVPNLRSLLARCPQICGFRYTVDDVLSLPCRRILQYPEFLNIMGRFVTTSEDYDKLGQLYASVNKKIVAIKDVQWEEDTHRRIHHLIATVENLPATLFKKSLRFIAEDNVIFESSNSPRSQCVAYLFNEVMICCEVLPGGGERFRYSWEVPSLIACDDGANPNGEYVIRLTMNDQYQAFTKTILTGRRLLFRSKDAKDIWFAKLQEAIGSKYSSTMEGDLFSSLVDESTVKLLEPPVGEGASGVVYRGTFLNEKDVAVKVIKHFNMLSDGERHAFMREVSLSRVFSCPQIVEFYGCVISPAQLWIISEFVPLGNLKSYLRNNTSIPIGFKLRAMLDAALGLAYLHKHYIMHRDVKTDNALVCSTSETAPSRIKITDFGASKIVKDRIGRAHTRIGTPIYVSPEVMKGEPYDFSTDVYSFGILMWEIIEQRVFFNYIYI